MINCEVLVLGGGPGGRSAAIKCAESGMSTVLMEKEAPGDKNIRESYFAVKTLIEEVNAGIKDLNKLIGNLDHKAKTMEQVWQVKLERSGVDVYKGQGIIQDSLTVLLHPYTNAHNSQTRQFRFNQLIIATGSVPGSPVESIEIDEQRILTHSTAVKPEAITKIANSELTILGGDVEGCEFASLYNKLGAKVNILEKQDRIMPGCDLEISKYLTEQFRKDGINVFTNYEITESRDLPGNHILVTGKRIPNLPQGMENLQLETDSEQNILVDELGKTNYSHIYAVGDVIGGIHSANTAIMEGKTAALNICTTYQPKDFSCIPYVFFSSPEITGVGSRECDLREQGIPFTKSVINLQDNLRAQTLGYQRGFIKVLLSNNEAEQYVLGIHIIGDGISEQIHLPAAAYKSRIPVSELVNYHLPHPTMAELIITAIDRARTNSYDFS